MHMRSQKINTVSNNEKGFASIVIALVLIIVLSLLTVGFAQLARREQQDSLDNQLSNQAFYAAESGINDTAKDIQSGAICDSSISSSCASTDTSSTTCMTAPGSPSGGTGTLPATALTANPNINSADDVSYSCLLVNLTPSSLVIDDTPPGSGQYLDFSTTQPLTSLTIQWGSFDGNNSDFPLSSTFPTQKFPAQSSWVDPVKPTQKYPPVLGFSLTPVSSGTITRSGLISNDFNVYLYPASDTVGGDGVGPGSSTEVAYSPGTQAPIVSGNCGNDGSGNYPCSVTITGLGGVNTSYLLYYTDFYDASNVYITGTSAFGPVDFIGQAQVDVTGKAQNVEKRLQVRLDANGTNGTVTDPPVLPDNAVEGQNICKREQTSPITSSWPTGTSFINPSGGTVNPPSSDPCDLDY